MSKRSLTVLLAIVASCTVIGCAQKKEAGDPKEKKVVQIPDTVAVISQDEDGVQENAMESDERYQSVEKEVKEAPRLNMARYDNLMEAAKQVGFSFRALKDFESADYHFSRFSITEDVEKVQDMEVAEPNNLVTIRYEDQAHMNYLNVTIFPYKGKVLQSATSAPVCYVSTETIHEINVDLSEYILRMVPVDYELTEEDLALDKEKIGFSTDGVTTKIEDDYFRKMYWTQEGVYYEIAVWERNAPLEKIKALVAEYMEADKYNMDN